MKKKGRREHPPTPTPNPHLRCEEKNRLQKVSNIHTQKQTSNIIKDAEGEPLICLARQEAASLENPPNANSFSAELDPEAAERRPGSRHQRVNTPVQPGQPDRLIPTR